MKTPAERMREELNATGCYALTGDTPGDLDLLAMDAALSDFDTELEQLVQDVFLGECSEDTLTRWELAVRPQRSTATPAQRKQMLLSRLAIHPHGSTVQACNALLPAAGAVGGVEETTGGITVKLAGTYGLTETQVQQELSQLLPAHLAHEITPVSTWQTIALGNRSFADWDELSLTWQELDALTREELKGD